jgi:hypothetical protein
MSANAPKNTPAEATPEVAAAVANTPANNNPTNNVPKNNQPKNNEPTNNQPKNNEPKNNQAKNNQPKNNEPTNNQPKNNQATNNQPTSNEPKNNTTKTNVSVNSIKGKLQKEIEELEKSLEGDDCAPVQETLKKVIETGTTVAKMINDKQTEESTFEEEKTKLQKVTNNIKAKCQPQSGGKRKTRKHKRKSRRV